MIYRLALFLIKLGKRKVRDNGQWRHQLPAGAICNLHVGSKLQQGSANPPPNYRTPLDTSQKGNLLLHVLLLRQHLRINRRTGRRKNAMKNCCKGSKIVETECEKERGGEAGSQGSGSCSSTV